MLESDRALLDTLREQGCVYSVVVKHPDGTLDRTEVRSLREVLLAPDDVEAVVARLADPGTHVVTLTVTEGGYGVDPAPGGWPGLLLAALVRRWDAGLRPFTVVSCDNLEGNGEVCRDAVVGSARLLDADLADRVAREVAFPSSMVDRITPGTTQADRDLVRTRFGVDDAAPVTCEPHLQWVLEDRFTDGRPPLETVGVQLVDDVRPYELMKLRLLNGGHQALAYAGLLLGHVSVADAATDPAVVGLLRAYLGEAVRTLEPVPEVDLDAYQESLLARFASRAVPDTLARLAAFSSDRVPGFVLPVLADGAPAAAAVVACWLRWTEAHPDAVVDRRPLRSPEQELADLEVTGLVLPALDVLRGRPVRQALEELTTAAAVQWGSGPCRTSQAAPTVDA